MIARLMGLKTISPHELSELLSSDKVIVFDVNAPQRWLEQRVPGARNLDHERMTEQCLPADKSETLVFYCSNWMCRKAPNAARAAERMGYEHVRVMSAGISGWVAAGLHTEQGR